MLLPYNVNFEVIIFKMEEVLNEGSEAIMEGILMGSHIKYWTRLIIGGLCLPFAFPWLVYWLYKNRLRYRLRRNRLLEDKVVLITGASSGLGEALAHEFYKAGCKVILAARRKDELERVKNDILNIKLRTTCYEPAVLCLDLGELKDIPSRAEAALQFYNKVDILVNNGGISYRGEALNTSLDVDLKVMVVNYFGHVVLTKALLPAMLKEGEGQIVAISSIQGKIAIPFRSAYAASKHAVQAFFDTLRAELGSSNINVCVVSPGYIKTNLSLNSVTGDGTSYGKMDKTTASGMDPLKAAEEIVQAIAFKNGELVLSGAMPKMAILLRWLWPSLYFYLMSKRAERLRKMA